MNLAALAQTSDALAATRSRSEKIRLLSDVLRQLERDERESGVAWLSGMLLEGRLGLGPAAIQRLRRVEPAGRSTLTVADTQQRLDTLRSIRGQGSAARRRDALAELFGRATTAEQSFLARLLLGELRQGALEGIMAEAIAAAASLSPADIRRAIMVTGDLARVAQAALSEGRGGLARFALRLYEPVKPMLASPTRDVASALGTLELAVFEYKLDGARVQIHKGDTGVRIYSRRGRDVTESLPEVSSTVAALPAQSMILDGEVLALDEAGRPRAFQDTMRRFGRKRAVDEAQSALPLSLFCFDCLHAEGEDLIDEPTVARLARLMELVPAELSVPRLLTSDAEAAGQFLGAALASGHEGLMAKSPGAPYEAGMRGAAWLKIKVAHTLDLVVLAAEWGSGRRRGWLSNLHLGARDPAGGFVMLGKTFKGLTDETLAWQTVRLKELAVGTDNYVVHVRPELVVEVAFNELQVSRRYPGGLALRFARVVRYRPDKLPEDADTIEAVRAMAAPGHD
jgi:DNA ligase-1